MKSFCTLFGFYLVTHKCVLIVSFVKIGAENAAVCCVLE